MGNKVAEVMNSSPLVKATRDRAVNRISAVGRRLLMLINNLRGNHKVLPYGCLNLCYKQPYILFNSYIMNNDYVIKSSIVRNVEEAIFVTGAMTSDLMNTIDLKALDVNNVLTQEDLENISKFQNMFNSYFGYGAEYDEILEICAAGVYRVLEQCGIY